MTTTDDRHRAPAALFLVLLLAGLLAAAAAAPAADARRRAERRCTPAGINALHGTARAERKVRCLLNRRRAASGLRGLRYNRCLDRAAERHARDMVRRRYFAHSSRPGGTPAQRARAAGYVPRSGGWTVAENLGWGLGAGAEPRAIVRGWLRSPGHRANILRGRYRDVGVAVVHGAPVRAAKGARKARATYVVEFGARDGGGRCGGRARAKKPRQAKRPRASSGPATSGPAQRSSGPAQHHHTAPSAPRGAKR
jgi:uncharacterized protein YkwD